MEGKRQRRVRNTTIGEDVRESVRSGISLMTPDAVKGRRSDLERSESEESGESRKRRAGAYRWHQDKKTVDRVKQRLAKEKW